ncbi:MAG: GTP 3',8-cyclase MoaA [Oscillospiraceae bacterium]|nr:GTP 3',8-cyclase MoaA [Oscillospiraceae bacterium]
MKDGFGRNIRYLRLSVTDLCQFRCVYCMPEAGVSKLRHDGILSVEECVEVCRVCASLGVTKIRLTGGEPLVRRGIVDICRGISQIEGVEELCLTTNGVLLPRYAKELKDAGVTRVNISLDTLDPEKFRRITRTGELGDVLAGLDLAEELFGHTKINCVLIGGVNDDVLPMVELTRDRDIDVRFIELMPIGECASWDRARFIGGDAVLKAVPELRPVGSGGVSTLYQVPGWRGRVGLISPMSHKFCSTCDRIRVTADGKLKPCLHSATEIPLKGLHGRELEETIAGAIRGKPQSHLMDETHRSDSLRGMSGIGG